MSTTDVAGAVSEGFCAACGEAVADGARFCRRCGAEQPAASAEAEACEVCGGPVVGSQRRCAICSELAPDDDQRAPVQQEVRPSPEMKTVSGDKRPRRAAFLTLIAGIVLICGAAGGVASYFIFIKDDRESAEVPVPRDSNSPREPQPTDPAERDGPTPGSGSGGESPVEDDWPDSRAGFTVALAAMGGPTGAERMAGRGRRAGLDPGVLRSRDYGSLTSDYWFVFHGTFDRVEQAREEVPRARRAGFRDAYVTYVSREEPVSTDDSSPDRAGEVRTQRRSGYSVEVPGDWPLVADEVDFGSHLRSKWRHPSEQSVFVVIDRTAATDEDALASARSMRSDTRDSRGYDELTFRRITMGERPAVEWRYRIGSADKIEYVINDCGASHAVRGVAPSGEFDAHATDFEQIAEALEPTC